MQNTLPLTPGNPLRNITGLARQISLPGEHAPMRFPSFPALERTAVMGFNQPTTLDLRTSTDTAITVFRQASYPVWADQLQTYNVAVDYLFDAVSGAAGNTNYVTRTALFSWSMGNRPALASAVGLSNFGSNAVTWPILGADRELGGVEFTYVPNGARLGCVFYGVTAFAAATNVTIDLEYWASPGEASSSSAIGQVLSGTTTITAGNTGALLTFAPLQINGWVRPRLVSVNTAGASVAITGLTFIVNTAASTAYLPSTTTAGVYQLTNPTDTSLHMPLVMPTEFSNSALPWFAARVTAAAILGTNVTQVLNKGGTVLGGRVSPAVQNAWTVGYSYIAGLHPAEKAYLPLETGVYTYCPPSTDLTFFTDYTLNTAAGAPSAPLFVLSNDSMYNKMFLRTAGVVEALACTVTWHIEFRTSSALFQVGLSALTLESLHQAQLVLAEAGFFFENPEHDKLLNRVISTAKKYAPDVVGAINPLAGKMLQSLVSRMSLPKAVKPKAGPKMPKTTTAESSGMSQRSKKPPPKGKGKGNKAKNK